MTINQDLFDAQTLHSVRVEFLKNGIVKRILEILQASDAELTVELRQKIESMQGTAFSIDRIERQLASIYEINRALYREMDDALGYEMQQFAEYETNWQGNLYERTLPSVVSFDRIGVAQVYASAVAKPFSGRLLSEWMSDLETETAKRIRDAVRLGFVQNETTDQIVRRIRGTKANNYADGLLQIGRNQAKTIVRTAIAHTANEARTATTAANARLFKYELWVSTLDRKTSPECQIRDGKKYEIGKGEYPPIHFNCRSVRIPVTKSWRELGFDIDELPPSTRSSMNGQVPEDTTYSAWLKKQPASIQDEVLGKERGRIYRETGAPLEKFVNREGKYYTLDDLKMLEL